ncbi:MAG: alanine--tRNA ligase [archaeon]
MDRKELIKKYIKFFKSKDHIEIKNSSLIPENDPTVLFTTAGMQPLVPFLLGREHPQGKRLVNVQRCIRTGDIDEVGDTYHHTFFEMLGNWSLGDYFKKEAIEYSFEFLTEVLNLPTERLAISIFKGDEDAPKDGESAEVWESLGISKDRISFLPKKENWWGPAGETGPCGPDTEMFYWKPNNKPAPKVFDHKDSNWVEIWNDVLMQYLKDKYGKYNEAKQKNIDTGMGVERTIAIFNGLEDNYLSEMWKPIIQKIESISKKSYQGNEREMRIIADHIKASVFIIADGVVPGNVEQGYVLRRLIRRAVRSLKKIEVPILQIDATVEIAKEVIRIYNDYDILQKNKDKILEELKNEEDRFQKTLDKGLKEFERMSKNKNIDGKESFLLYQSYGFPVEMTKELAKEKGIKVDEKGFEKELAKHQELSRTSSAGKFKSGLADNSEQTTKLHTVCHILNESLRIVLDRPDIYQKGSNITPERLRFDFNFDRGLTPEEIKKVEDLVNLKIKSNLPVTCELMSLKKAKESGAQGVFDSKYSEDVRVYSIGDFSKEICAGPHVENTSELGHFKITKEQSSSAGVRRIKAILE